MIEEANDDFGFMERRRPPWQAPIAGAFVVALAGVWVASRMGVPITVRWLSGCGGTGLLIGCLVALTDGPGPGTQLSRFLALISPIAAVLPIAGLALSAVAYWSNRRCSGWYRTLSCVALVESVAFHLFAALLLIYGT